MQRSACALLFLICLAVAAASPDDRIAPLIPAERKVQDDYLIVLTKTSPRDAALKAVENLQRQPDWASGNNKVHNHMQVGEFKVIHARLSQGMLNHVRRQPEVAYVEEDGYVNALYQTQQNTPSWGLPRVSQRSLNVNGQYFYQDSAGAGVRVFVLDTGIQANQSDFGGRAIQLTNYVSGETNEDLNGHGTFVAGVIGGYTYGVAKQVTLYGIKVLSGQGSGTWSNVINGINLAAWLVVPGKTVINLSLGGGSSVAVNDAVNSAYAAGCVVVAAAGNTNGNDACFLSPGSAANAFTVAASDVTDSQAAFSSVGPCVDMYAPGVNIKSLWKGPDGTTNTISGTSFSAPHVAGIAALLMTSKQYTSPGQVYADLIASATNNVLKNVSPNTVNRLAFNNYNA